VSFVCHFFLKTHHAACLCEQRLVLLYRLNSLRQGALLFQQPYLRRTRQWLVIYIVWNGNNWPRAEDLRLVKLLFEPNWWLETFNHQSRLPKHLKELASQVCLDTSRKINSWFLEVRHIGIHQKANSSLFSHFLVLVFEASHEKICVDLLFGARNNFNWVEVEGNFEVSSNAEPHIYAFRLKVYRQNIENSTNKTNCRTYRGKQTDCMIWVIPSLAKSEITFLPLLSCLKRLPPPASILASALMYRELLCANSV